MDLAVVDGVTRWDRSTLDRRADGFGRALIALGVGRGDRVALLARPSAAAIAAIHGVARVGAVIAPLGTGLTPTELTAAAAVVMPRVVVHGADLAEAQAALGIGRLALDDGGSMEAGDDASARTGIATPTRGSPDEPAAAILTSGTTGQPKVVLLSDAALEASADAWLATLPPATGWLLAVGLAHVAGLGVVWRAALAGVPLVVLDRPDPAAILAALTADPSPSHVSLVPTTLTRIMDLARDAPPPATVRAVPLGGGTIPSELVRRALAAGWPVVPTYGLSEAGSGVTALPTDEAAAHPDSAGRPLPGVDIRIAGPDPIGAGEIEVRSPARFIAYLGDPASTASVLTSDGWLRTGDVGRLDVDGRLFVLDRRTDRIVRGGENISPSEVEAVLLDHPAIAEAAVVARRDPTMGHVPVAAVVLREGAADPGDEAMASHCRERLAAFKVPAAFIRVATLPRTDSGKLRRVEMRAMLEPEPAPAEDASAPPEPPRPGDVERPDGTRIAWRSFGRGPTHLLLLHGTLSTAGQLTGLARDLAAGDDRTVHAVDRRGSGASRLADPTPLDIEVHVGDLRAILDAESLDTAVLVGVSFGGIVALEFAARLPERVTAVVAYEPPYGPAADRATQRAFATVAVATERAYDRGGAPAAAEAFMRGVAGEAPWNDLPERARKFLADEGASAYVDAGLRGLHPAGLGDIRVPTTIVTGDASEPFYSPIADALAARIAGARRVHLPGMTHASPITDPAPVADAIRAALATGESNA